MANLDDLALFVGIVDAGSLAAAARAAGLPKSSVSRRLVALETRLNTRLVQRSTRKLSLTDAGHRLYERCSPLVAEALAAEADVRSESTEPRGVLRVTATGAFGRLYVGPLLGEFLARYQDVSAELSLLDRTVNLIEEGFDVAIRMGELDDSDLIGRKLGDIERMLCAAPAYLERMGDVAELGDLKRHVTLSALSGNRWRFTVGDRVTSVMANGRLVSNQIEVLYAATLQGCGIAVLPRFLVLDDLTSGRLVKLLPETPPTNGAAQALWPSRRNVSARTRSFVDFIAERLQRPGAWDRPMLDTWQRTSMKPTLEGTDDRRVT